MKIAAYCRVSTDKEEQIDSLNHQKEFFTEYAQRNGHQLYRLYADEGITGTSLKKREEFKRLLQDAELGLFQMVVVKDISRFARNTVDALQSIRKLKSMGINTLFLTANMDSMGDSEFVLTLFSAMAQEESNNLSKRVKWGKKINAEKGRVPQRVFGYDRIDNFTLQINSDEARIVRKIFSLYIEQGLGCRTISMTLNREHDKTKFGSEWNPRGVRRVLVNPLYCGILVNHKYEIEDFLTGKQVNIPKEEHFFHERPSWAIVAPETFQKAQEIMDARRIKYDCGEAFRDARYSAKHTFSTLIKCEHCGRSFSRKSYTYVNTRVYWRCPTNDQFTAEKCDNGVIIDEPDLLQQIRAYLASQIADKEAFIAEVTGEASKHAKMQEDPEAIKRELESKQKKLNIKKERYQEMYANDLIDIEELKEKLETLNKGIKETQRSLEQLLVDGKIGSNMHQAAELYRAEIENFLNLQNVTNVDMRKVIERICVNRDGDVKIFLKQLKNQ